MPSTAPSVLSTARSRGVDPLFKDIAGLLADFGTLAAVIVGGIGIAREIRKNREERKRSREQSEEAARLREEDLRWRRASAARELLSDIHRSELATKAIEMMDWRGGEHSYRLPSGTATVITLRKVREALGRVSPQDEAEVFIVDCFDWFLFYLDRVEHYVQNKLILFEDVSRTLKPYVQTLKTERLPISALVERRCYEGVQAFLQRFPEVGSSGTSPADKE